MGNGVSKTLMKQALSELKKQTEQLVELGRAMRRWMTDDIRQHDERLKEYKRTQELLQNLNAFLKEKEAHHG